MSTEGRVLHLQSHRVADDVYTRIERRQRKGLMHIFSNSKAVTNQYGLEGESVHVLQLSHGQATFQNYLVCPAIKGRSEKECSNAGDGNKEDSLLLFSHVVRRKLHGEGAVSLQGLHSAMDGSETSHRASEGILMIRGA